MALLPARCASESIMINDNAINLSFNVVCGHMTSAKPQKITKDQIGPSQNRVNIFLIAINDLNLGGWEERSVFFTVITRRTRRCTPTKPVFPKTTLTYPGCQRGFFFDNNNKLFTFEDFVVKKEIT